MKVCSGRQQSANVTVRRSVQVVYGPFMGGWMSTVRPWVDMITVGCPCHVIHWSVQRAPVVMKSELVSLCEGRPE